MSFRFWERSRACAGRSSRGYTEKMISRDRPRRPKTRAEGIARAIAPRARSHFGRTSRAVIARCENEARCAREPRGNARLRAGRMAGDRPMMEPSDIPARRKPRWEVATETRAHLSLAEQTARGTAEDRGRGVRVELRGAPRRLLLLLDRLLRGLLLRANEDGLPLRGEVGRLRGDGFTGEGRAERDAGARGRRGRGHVDDALRLGNGGHFSNACLADGGGCSYERARRRGGNLQLLARRRDSLARRRARNFSIGSRKSAGTFSSLNFTPVGF